MKIEDLDTILLYLKNKNEYTKYIDIKKDNPNIDCDSVIIKLEKDGYINSGKQITRVQKAKSPFSGDIQIKEEIIKHNIYRPSFEGFVFIELGGYKQSVINQNSENARIERLEISQRKYERYVLYLTLATAFGAIIQALYNCVELYWKYHWFRF